MCLVKQRVAQYTKYIKRTSIKLTVMLGYGYKTICRDCRINLDSNSIFGVSPKGLHSEMLLYPAKEQFYLPTFFVEQGYVFGLECKIVGQERERSFKVRSIVNYSPHICWILLLGLIAVKAYCLVKKNIIHSIQKLSAVNHIVIKTGLLPYNEERSDSRYCVQSCKVIIPFVKNVECIRLIWYLIHRVHIMDFCLRDMYVNWYLGNNVIQRVNLDATFCFSKTSPFVETETEIDCCRVKGVKFAINNELPINSLALRKVYHTICELFKNPIIPVCISIFQRATSNNTFAKSEMIAFVLMSSNNASKFSETITAGQLTETKQQQLVPARHRLRPFVTIITLYNFRELFVGKKANELTEYIFSAIHACLDFIKTAMIQNEFKSFSLHPSYIKLNINSLHSDNNFLFGH